MSKATLYAIQLIHALKDFGSEHRTMAVELSPGEASPWATKFGSQFESLPASEKASITHEMTQYAAKIVGDHIGVDLSGLLNTSGAWMRYPPSPNSTVALQADPNLIKAASHGLAGLLDQTEVWAVHAKPKDSTMPSNGLVVDLSDESGEGHFADNDKVASTWSKLLDSDSEAMERQQRTEPLIKGYMVVRGQDNQPTMRLVVDEDTANSVGGIHKASEHLSSTLENEFASKAKEFPNIKHTWACGDIYKARNDYKENQNGEDHQRGLVQFAGPDTAASILSRRPELDERLGNLIEESSQRSSQKALGRVEIKERESEGQVELVSPSCIAVRDGLLRMRQLAAEGRFESAEADALRDAMDISWKELSDVERDGITGLSADMNAVSRYTGEFRQDPKAIVSKGGESSPIYDKSLEEQDAYAQISTANPKHGDPHASGVHHVTLENIRNNDPELYERNAKLVQDYSQYRDSHRTNDPDKAHSRMIGVIASNLRYMYDRVPEQTRERSKHQYDGARRIVEEFSDKSGLTRPQVGGVIAVLSPGFEWYANVANAERVIDIHKRAKNDEIGFSPAMGRTLDAAISGVSPRTGKPNKINDDLRNLLVNLHGKSYNDLNDHVSKSQWITYRDMAHNDPRFHVLSPEGERLGYKEKVDGEPATMMWQMTGPIAKAVRILEDGSIDHISRELGYGHKIRNFANNIILPDSLGKFGCVDTHQVATGLMSPLSQQSPEVGDSMERTLTAGYGGTYGIHHEAMCRVADEISRDENREYLPRELQSICWEAGKSMFDKKAKGKEGQAEAGKLWLKYKTGKASLKETQDNLYACFGGVKPYIWEEMEAR